MGYKVEVEQTSDEGGWPRPLRGSDPDGLYVGSRAGLVACYKTGNVAVDCSDGESMPISDFGGLYRPLAKGEQIIITKE